MRQTVCRKIFYRVEAIGNEVYTCIDYDDVNKFLALVCKRADDM